MRKESDRKPYCGNIGRSLRQNRISVAIQTCFVASTFSTGFKDLLFAGLRSFYKYVSIPRGSSLPVTSGWYIGIMWRVDRSPWNPSGRCAIPGGIITYRGKGQLELVSGTWTGT